MTTSTTDYNVQQGELWERLVIIKDRRTRRKRVPTEAAATVRIALGGVTDGDYVIPVEITSEGGVLMQILPVSTKWLPVGTHNWDMVCTVSRAALLTSTPTEEKVVVKGTLTVTAMGNITPMDVDVLAAVALDAVA